MEQTFIGIDVSKDRLDVHVRPSDEAFAVARDGVGLAALVERLGALDPRLVVLEATGGFELTVAAALAAAGMPLAVVNPRQIRDFARATGQLAKTDALDAKVIARFAEQVRPEPRPVPDAQARALGELVARRRQIIEMMTAERNRRGQLTSREDAPRCEAPSIWPPWSPVGTIRCSQPSTNVSSPQEKPRSSPSPPSCESSSQSSTP